MTGKFTTVDFDVLIDLWQKQVPEQYAITAKLLESHTVGSPVFDLQASHWVIYADKLRGFICVKKNASPELYDGGNPLQAHIQALVFENFDYAKQLLDSAIETLKGKGIQKIVFGQDSRHIFPGAPQDWPQLSQALTDVGFKTKEVQVDLQRDLATYEAPAGVMERLVEPYSVRPCTAADLPALQQFFSHTFSGRWRHDVLEKWKLEGPETIMALFDQTNQTIEGFALIQQEGCQLPIGGAVWHRSLGANWGGLGPIGVSEAVRGKGLGDALLAASLLELKQRGARETIIDWTTLIEFYGKHGFEPRRRYHSMHLEL